jgi:hypothetical protein
LPLTITAAAITKVTTVPAAINRHVEGSPRIVRTGEL